ncbi:MAG: hypothetical protein AMJ90_01405 [candidate division Zixibacteria bacterium SM23_73_2]|nr:MAG: hypothetical protein AMJ90_01405 [candidate division Zixibacteria bacterium SM23_73_2]
MSGLRYLDYFFITRPVLMPPVWTILLLGYQRSFFYSGQKENVVWIFVLIFFLVGSIYILNQIFDKKSDLLNKKLFFLSQGLVKDTHAWLEAILLFALSFIGAFIISINLGFLFVLGFILGYLYSCPPFFFKNRPLWGFLSNTLGHGSLVFLIGWQVNSNVGLDPLLFSIPYFLAVGAVYLNTTLPDIQGDREAKKITLGVKLGVGRAAFVSAFFVFFSLLLALWLKDYHFFFPALLSFPFFVRAALTKRKKDIILSVKLAVLFLSIVAGSYHLWYFLVLIIGFLGTRFYYRKRFGMTYPSLT